MYNHCRITHVSAMLGTRVSTVRLILMSVCHHRAKTTPRAGSSRTKVILASAMSLRQALTACVLLVSLVTAAVLFT